MYDVFNGRLDIVNDLLVRANFRMVTLWALGVGLLFQIVLTRTRFGNQVFATGGNPQAALARA